MLHFHITLALNLIALGIGGLLLAAANKTTACCSWLSNLLAYLIIILAILSTMCTMNTGYQHWKSGDYDMKNGMETHHCHGDKDCAKMDDDKKSD